MLARNSKFVRMLDRPCKRDGSHLGHPTAATSTSPLCAGTELGHIVPGLRLGQPWLLFLDGPTLLVTCLSWGESPYHGTMAMLCTYLVNFLQGAQKTLCCLRQPRSNPTKQAGSCCPTQRAATESILHKAARSTHWLKSMVYKIGKHSTQETGAGFPMTAPLLPFSGFSSFHLLWLTAKPQISTICTGKLSQ